MANQGKQWYVECPWIDVDRFVTNMAVGGAGGGKFELIGEEGTYLKKLVVFMEHDRVMGITATLSDGRTETVGRTKAHSVLKFSFDAGEEFRRVVMRGARVPSYGTVLFGGMTIKTAGGLAGGREIDAMAERRERLGDNVEYPVGSGTCAGVFGRCGWEIDCFGFAMEKRHLAG